MDETTNNTANALADAAQEIANDAEQSQTFGQFVAKVIQSKTILGLFVLLVPLIAKEFKTDSTVGQVILGAIMVLVGRMNPDIKPLTRKAAKSAAKVAAPLLLISLMFLGGCQDNPRTLDLRANRLVSSANASILAARAIAPAAGVSKAETQRVEREVILPAVAAEQALLGELNAASDAYTLAVAANDQAAVARAEDRGQIAFDALLAVTNRLNQVLAEYQRQAATRPAN